MIDISDSMNDVIKMLDEFVAATPDSATCGGSLSELTGFTMDRVADMIKAIIIMEKGNITTSIATGMLFASQMTKSRLERKYHLVPKATDEAKVASEGL